MYGNSTDISSVQAFSFTAPGKEMAMNIRKSHLLASNRNNGSVSLRVYLKTPNVTGSEEFLR